MSTASCTPQVIGASIGTLIVAAMFVSMIVKQKKAAKGKKPIPLTPKGMEIVTYIFLAGASLNIVSGMVLGVKPYNKF
jgi:hypothetical protein